MQTVPISIFRIQSVYEIDRCFRRGAVFVDIGESLFRAGAVFGDVGVYITLVAGALLLNCPIFNFDWRTTVNQHGNTQNRDMATLSSYNTMVSLCTFYGESLSFDLKAPPLWNIRLQLAPVLLAFISACILCSFFLHTRIKKVCKHQKRSAALIW